MTGLYLLVSAGLLLAAVALGRWRAQVIAGGRYAQMHSLPLYHGLFVACGVFVPLLAVFVAGTPLTAKLASSAALAQLPTEVQLDPLRAGEFTSLVTDSRAVKKRVNGPGQPVRVE